MDKIWANSGDSHLLEPADLWEKRLAPKLAERAPRTERTEKYETIYLDGERMHRLLAAFSEAMRPPGASDIEMRLKDLDQEGISTQTTRTAPSLSTFRTSGSSSCHPKILWHNTTGRACASSVMLVV